MGLYFSAISGPFAANQNLKTIRFGNGGLIGRAPECTLVLDDGQRQVSRQHAKVSATAEGYVLEVLSEVSPIMINGELFAHGQTHVLRQDDKIAIGPFVLCAQITVTANETTADSKPDLNAALHWLGQGMRHPLHAPADSKTEDYLKQLGEVLAELLEGTRRLAMLRTGSKGEFVPADRTIVSKTDLNPIKHATSRAELFKYMFPEQHTGLIDPVASVRDVMNDLHVHEVAMQAGMRAALHKLLTELDPAAFEGKNSGFLGGLFGASQLRAWQKRHAELKDSVVRGNTSVVWDEFASGYREEINRQKARKV